jgi:hypothetical protein
MRFSGISDVSVVRGSPWATGWPRDGHGMATGWPRDRGMTVISAAGDYISQFPDPARPDLCVPHRILPPPLVLAGPGHGIIALGYLCGISRRSSP